MGGQCRRFDGGRSTWRLAWPTHCGVAGVEHRLQMLKKHTHSLWHMLASRQNRGEGQYPLPRAMSDEDIADAIAGFAQAAVLSKGVVGFDGVEIHGANGYLLDQFLTDYTNQRDDRWGGNVQARIGLTLEVIKAVRAAFGTLAPICLALMAIGLGVGQAWPHLLTRVLLGAALAGMVANVAGLTNPAGAAGIANAAAWLFGVFAFTPILVVFTTRRVIRLHSKAAYARRV